MAFISCPKCNHKPLPENQAFPAACPGCGIIFAKLGERVARVPSPQAAPLQDDGDSVAPDPGWRDGILSMLFHVPDRVDKLNWGGRIFGLLVCLLWTYFIWRDMDIPGGDAGSYFLHVIITPFHEAGHYLIFRWFGRFIMILGGTLGQHLFFVVLGIALLWKRRDPYGAALFLWGLGFSISDMGVYMYDAFDPKIMLLDGRTGADSDGHDWQNLFDMMGVLRHARGIGLFFGWAGKAVMVAGLVWAAWMIWLQHAKLSDAAGAETELD
jgi:hypothetical protein